MVGKAILQWYNEATDTMESVCECYFNKKGILYHTGEVFHEEFLPVICYGTSNLTRSLSSWLKIRERWKLRPDCKLQDIGNNLNLLKRNTYQSPFDNYSFRTEEPDGEFNSHGALNYPLQKECFIDGVCVYSREINKDSLLYRLCVEADLTHVFEPGSYEIIKIDGVDTLCWKTRIDKKYEYIPFIEYVSPFLLPGVSKALAVVRCCKHYKIPGWQDLFFELCSIDGIVEIEKDLDSLFVMREREDIHTLGGLALF